MRLLLRLLMLAALAGPLRSSACTLFKITQGGRTMVGNNEDAWGLDPWIRFVPAREGGHGVAYVGHRDGLPQGGMNDAGLVFDGLVVPFKAMQARPGRTPVGDTFAFVEHLLRTCATVADVRTLLAGYDWTSQQRAIILFVDRAGNYLVMEGGTLLSGSDPTYVAGNFRPSQYADLDRVAIPRFQQGRAYLAAHGDTSLRSCAGMMEAMKACRRKLGEGTLYTSIYDLQRGLVHLYFYHDFTQVRTFDLEHELAQGEHTLRMADLFPPNAEYARLARFRTPFNSGLLRWGITVIALVGLVVGSCAAIALVRTVVAWRRRKGQVLPWMSLALAGGLAVMLAAMLLMDQGVYYFGLKDASLVPALPWAWVPVVLLGLTLPLVRLLVRREHRPFAPQRWLLVGGSAAFLGLVGFCAYWGILLP